VRHPLVSRMGSREADIAPDRGAQGNALKTLLAMPFALDGNADRVVIFSPSRTKPSMDARGRIVDQPFEARFLWRRKLGSKSRGL
jgi:hypothetical protein